VLWLRVVSRTIYASSSLSSSSTSSNNNNDDNLYREFLKANRDKLVVIRFVAPWCKLCHQLQPQFMALIHATASTAAHRTDNDNDNNDGTTIVWADYTVRSSTRDYAVSLGIEKVPTISVHVPGGLVELVESPSASKLTVLKQKLRLFVANGSYPTELKP
jgi:thiol-disulfide isomerase/thioredoxin